MRRGYPHFLHMFRCQRNNLEKGSVIFFGAMRIDAFRSAEDFKKNMDDWISGFRNAKPVDGQERVLVPGDPEREMETERRQNGIPVHESVLADLIELAGKFSISWPD